MGHTVRLVRPQGPMHRHWSRRVMQVPEQSSGALVPEGRLSPGTLHTISMGSTEMPGIYRLEIQSIPGTGKANVSGVAPREAVRVAFDYFKANSS